MNLQPQPQWKKWISIAKNISTIAHQNDDPNRAWCDLFEEKLGLLWGGSWDRDNANHQEWLLATELPRNPQTKNLQTAELQSITKHPPIALTHLLDWHFAFNEGYSEGMLFFFRHAHKNPQSWQSAQYHSFKKQKNEGQNDYPNKKSNNLLKEEMYQMNLYRTISYNPETLLEKDDDYRTLAFLFLFYHPFNTNANMLFHHQGKIPLITFPQISQKHFDMLLYLTEHETPTEWPLFKKDFNLNHQLISRFIENMQPISGLYRGKEIINWEQLGMPIEKIKKFLKKGFLLDDFEQLRTDRTWLTFRSMSDTIHKLIAEEKEAKMREAIFYELGKLPFVSKIKKV